MIIATSQRLVEIEGIIRILKEEADWFDIPEIKDDFHSYQQLSQKLTEYGPLIKNYNEVIASAQKFKMERSNETLQSFYISSSRFAFETITIIGAVYYTASFKTVGEVYRASGLQHLAFKCSSCISIALSSGHWTLRNSLVEGSSMTANYIMKLKIGEFEKIKMKQIRNEVNILIDSQNLQDLKKTGNYVFDNAKNITEELWNGMKSVLN